MKEIKEIIDLIHKENLSIDIERSFTPDSKIRKLYNGIKKGDVNNDEEALQLLYKKNEANGSYRRLKNRLKSSLVNKYLIHMKSDKGSDTRQIAYFNAYRKWITIKILVEKGANVWWYTV